MNDETKLFVGIIFVTVLIIVGAVFAFSRPIKTSPVDPKVLMSDDSYRIGSPSASVTLVEFGDFQCPACSVYHAVVKKILEENTDSLSLVFRHFPLSSHANAFPAARAAEAAGIQGKFWDMYNKLYETQNDWSAEKNTFEIFTGYAKEFGLDSEQFKKDFESNEVQMRIDKDISDANILGINSTPTFFLNNTKIENPASLKDFENIIKTAILAPK